MGPQNPTKKTPHGIPHVGGGAPGNPLTGGVPMINMHIHMHMHIHMLKHIHVHLCVSRWVCRRERGRGCEGGREGGRHTWKEGKSRLWMRMRDQEWRREGQRASKRVKDKEKEILKESRGRKKEDVCVCERNSVLCVCVWGSAEVKERKREREPRDAHYIWKALVHNSTKVPTVYKRLHINTMWWIGGRNPGQDTRKWTELEARERGQERCRAYVQEIVILCIMWNSRQKMGWHRNCRARSLSACNARPL